MSNCQSGIIKDVTNSKRITLVTSNGLKQLKKKFTTLYTTKKENVGRKMCEKEV